MTDPSFGPFVFDTSAEEYLSQTRSPAERAWLDNYLSFFFVHVSFVTIIERVRGFALLLERAGEPRHSPIERALQEYLQGVQESTRVLSLSTLGSIIAAHLMALLPSPPSPVKRSHRAQESKQGRLARWRFDIMIAATALEHGLPLIHNNPQDFEPIRAVIETSPGRFPGVGPLNLISVKRLAA